MGHLQHTLHSPDSTSCSRLRSRDCLRQGCGHVYQPRRWNQRYCQDPECLRLVRRWQAAKRQQQRRAHPEVLQAHAATERQRRARRREESRLASEEVSVTPADGAVQGRAWSRSKSFLAPFCDRPGCYEAVRLSRHFHARYCGDDCRQAMKRVRDRERKWLRRNPRLGRFQRGLKQEPERSAPRSHGPPPEAHGDWPANRSCSTSRRF